MAISERKELRKSIFPYYFLSKDISVVIKLTKLKFEICTPQTETQGSVSLIFHRSYF